MKKEFDIVLFGATGFTGELVAEYLRDHPQPNQRVALAGRNQEKLERVRDRLGVDWELVIADSADQKSLDTMAASAHVVCTTVGPYDQYGKGVVRACVEHGAHYCDLTGEPHFIRAMIDKHHDTAVENGVRIVNCCGFDSIPSDLGVLILQEASNDAIGVPCDTVEMFITMKGGFSGGTIATVSNTVQKARSDRNLRRLLVDPYALNPDGQKPDLKQRDQQGAVYSKTIGKWTGPFVMAPVNTRIVRRSNALMDHRYGESFRYSETMVTGSGFKGRAMATGLGAGLAAFMGAMAINPVRSVLEKTVLPESGEGPTKEEQEAGYFSALFVGHHDGKEILRATVKGFKDPGYGATAQMLGESAKCLAFDDLETDGGIVTPATAMGDALVDRLRDAGMTLQIDQTF